MSSSCCKGGTLGMYLELWLMQGVCLLSGVWVTPPETKECGAALRLNSRPCHPPVIVRVSGLTWDSPRCHFWMFRSLLTRRPGARAVVCILMTDSHISIVLIPANIISTEGFISGREKKQPSFFKSQVISVLSRVKLYRGRFFISNKRFYTLVNLVDVICT